MKQYYRIFKGIIYCFLILGFLADISVLNLLNNQVPSPLKDKFLLLKKNIFQVDAAGLSSASATLSNPRLSFYAQVNTTVNIGGSVITVKASGNNGDLDTRNLFPNDYIVVGSGINYNQVASVAADLVTFTLKNPLVTQAAADAVMTASQAGTLTVRFYTSSAIPANGSIKISVPAPSSGGNDGVPDTTASISTNGFDTNGMTNANTTCPGGFTAGTFTTGTGGAAHSFTCNLGATALPAGANITFVIGNAAKPLINPAPLYTGHTRGLADIYTIRASTYDAANGTGNIVDDITVRTAPVEGVLVTATIDETLSFTVAGVAATSGDYCGVTHSAAGITTTATSVPWGTLTSNYTADRNNAVQQLTVTTNAPSGYNVYAEANDQMGKDGNACTGGTPTAEPYTYSGGGVCIRDYNKGSATWTTYSDWTNTPGTDYGFGYSLENVSGGGTDARFLYNTSGGTFNTKHFADQENSQDKYATNADVMYNTGLVVGSSVYVCYRIHIPGSQPAGYYFNNLKYTAVPKF